jgi:homoserine dehydrogenase
MATKTSYTKILEHQLLAILDTTQSVEVEIAREQPDLALIKNLVTKRGKELVDFDKEYHMLKEANQLDNKYLETFTKIYTQIINKHFELVDTTNRKLNTISNELSSIRKERKMRTSYKVNRLSQNTSNSVLITSKIQG